MAPASARPSKVLVPRPISSISTRLRSVAPCTIAAASVISSMKVDLRVGQIVGGADAGVDRVDRPEPAGGRRHERAHRRQQHDQRHLAHVGALAAHVRAGDDQHARLRVEPAVVGDEVAGAGLGQPRFDHRVAAGLDLDARARATNSGAAPVRASAARSASAASASSVASARASACSAGRCGCSASSSCSYSHFSRASARSWADSALSSKRLQLGRDVALGVLQRLAAAVVGRHLVGVRRA